MTPKEKARELVGKFLINTNSWEDVPKESQSNRLAIHIGGLAYIRAKQCALIAVDEIIKQYQSFPDNINLHITPYWLEVKTEIETYDPAA